MHFKAENQKQFWVCVENHIPSEMLQLQKIFPDVDVLQFVFDLEPRTFQEKFGRKAQRRISKFRRFLRYNPFKCVTSALMRQLELHWLDGETVNIVMGFLDMRVRTPALFQVGSRVVVKGESNSFRVNKVVGGDYWQYELTGWESAWNDPKKETNCQNSS